MITMENKNNYTLEEIIDHTGLSQEIIFQFIEEEWIVPYGHSPYSFDNEDLARLFLIDELLTKMGVNYEGLPIILHLLDQIYGMNAKIKEDFNLNEGSNENEKGI